MRGQCEAGCPQLVVLSPCKCCHEHEKQNMKCKHPEECPAHECSNDLVRFNCQVSMKGVNLCNIL